MGGGQQECDSLQIPQCSDGNQISVQAEKTAVCGTRFNVLVVE